MQAIYQYVDFRKYLNDAIAAKRQTMQAFSFELLCRRAGSLTKSHLSLILSGKRNLSDEKAEGLSRALELSESEARYFRHLVRFNQAKNSDEKEFHLNSMLIESQRSRSDSLPLNSYRILNAWHCLAIRELARLPNFESSPEAVSSRFRGLLTESEADHALKALIETGLLVEGSDGRLVPSDEILRTTDEVNSVAIRKYHMSCLDLGQKILDLDSVENREFGSVNILLKAGDRSRIKEVIRSFREQILALAADESDPDALVTQVNIQMFHITA